MFPVEEGCHRHSCRVFSERKQEGIAQNSGSLCARHIFSARFRFEPQLQHMLWVRSGWLPAGTVSTTAHSGEVHFLPQGLVQCQGKACLPCEQTQAEGAEEPSLP